MKILHLTDFHFDGSAKYKEDELRIIDALLDSLKKFKDEINIVLFTGDLVWQGNDLDKFKEIKIKFLDRICEVLNINITSLFICPGNHDVYRGQELEELTESLFGIDDNDKLNHLVNKNKGRTLTASLENLKVYYDFQKELYTEHRKVFKDCEVDNMYSTHIREINGKKIGVTTINSSWRSNDSKTDSGNLMYPIYYLKNAISEIKMCDIKILMLHHPLSDFRHWNQYQLEDIIFRDYHLMFSGHVHNNRDSLHITAGTGIYHSTSAATLSNRKDSIGFTIVDIEEESFDLKLTNAFYKKNEELFYYGEPKSGQIPLDQEKFEQNNFRRTIRKRFEGLSKESNKLFLSYKEKLEDNDFIHLFTEPIIRYESQTNPKPKNNKKLRLIDLINNVGENQIIFGKDKSGKSAILHKISLDILHDFNKLKMLPIFIDCGRVINQERKIDMIDLLGGYYEVNKRKAAELVSKYHIKILLDNFKENEALILQPISQFLKENKNSTIIAMGNETMFASFIGGYIGDINFTNRYIHDITRTEIRMLTDKWPNISKNKREQVIEKIHTVFRQLNIPSNYWTVSLFIWIFEKNIDVKLGNNFQLIELYIDSLLDKHNFILSNKYKIDFDDLKDFLSSLAHTLIIKYHKESYLIKYSEFIEFIEDYKYSNKKFVIETKDLADLLTGKGIIKSINEEKYTFRLNGVFEYFVGYYMAYDEDFRNSAINDNHFYLSFKNEFEVCAGIIPQNFEFINNIFNKTRSIFKEVNTDIDTNNLDALLKSKISETFNISNELNLVLKETIKDSLEPEQQDSILESLSPSVQRISDVKQKKFYTKIEGDSEDLENALYILGRVFRNSKLKNKDELNNEIFNFILSSSCTFSLSLIDEISSQKVNEIDANISEEKLIKLLTQFLPILAQTFFFDITIQANLEIIIKEKIEELKRSKKGNELKLLILYFSIVDLDLKNHSDWIDEIIEVIEIPILKQSTVFKLYLYLGFKCNGNINLRDKIEKFIKKQELKIDNRQNVGDIEQRIKAVEKSSKNK